MKGRRRSILRIPFRLWMIGVLIGLLCAFMMSDTMGNLLKESLKERIQNNITLRTWLSSLWSHGRFMMILGVLTYIPYSMVWLQTVMAGHGFVFGFSLQVLFGIYGIRGLIGAACAYIPHNLLLLPVLIYTMICMEANAASRYRKQLWICICIMMLLASWVEMKTAPLLRFWCVEGTM